MVAEDSGYCVIGRPQIYADPRKCISYKLPVFKTASSYPSNDPAFSPFASHSVQGTSSAIMNFGLSLVPCIKLSVCTGSAPFEPRSITLRENTSAVLGLECIAANGQINQASPSNGWFLLPHSVKSMPKFGYKGVRYLAPHLP